MEATPSTDILTLQRALAEAQAEAAREKAINADLAARLALFPLPPIASECILTSSLLAG